MRKIANPDLGRPSAEEFAKQQRMPVVVVLDNIRSANNVGSFFRTGDAFGIERIVLCGITGTPPSRDIHKSALGAEQTIAWSYEKDTAEALRALKAEGYEILAIEQVNGAEFLGEFTPDFVSGKKYALIFGNEVEGVRENLLPLCDGAIEIPQVGTKHSLNVSVSGGAVLWEFFRHWRHTSSERDLKSHSNS